MEMGGGGSFMAVIVADGGPLALTKKERHPLKSFHTGNPKCHMEYLLSLDMGRGQKKRKKNIIRFNSFP